ncbi:MAG: hypothetical protein LBL93_07370 [Ruminococcus sp.]|nr:hypothetical protein [Ruminococcus sp.]
MLISAFSKEMTTIRGRGKAEATALCYSHLPCLQGWSAVPLPLRFSPLEPLFPNPPPPYIVGFQSKVSDVDLQNFKDILESSNFSPCIDGFYSKVSNVDLQNFKNILESSNFSPCIDGFYSKVSDVNLQNFKNILESSNFSPCIAAS